MSINNEQIYHYNRNLMPHENVHTIYKSLRESNYTVLLQSSDSYSPKTSRFSIISAFPEMLITLRDSQLTLKQVNNKPDLKRNIHIANSTTFLSILSSLLEEYKPLYDKNLEHLPFLGGLLGYISYDFIRYIEKIPFKNVPDYIADAEFILTKTAVIIDHKESIVWAISNNKETLEILKQRINLCSQETDSKLKMKLVGEKKVSFTEDEFIEKVDKTKDYICQGEIYQANISIQFNQILKVKPFEFYKHLYNLNPSPFCAYAHIDDLFIICNSPERLVKSYIDGRVETRPIAGTRGRSKNNTDDNKLEEEMIQSAKERSEHIMLVDLERNDLGKVSEYGTVEVDELFTVEKYSHVMHLVSNVRSQLNNKYSFLDLIPAVFPGGTITGVPKIRCMEIIEELENYRRGLYTGSIGYMDFRGSMDLNIVIRTMTLEEMPYGNYYAKMQFGAGIVADSIGKYEYKECIKKGMAIFDLLKSAEQVL
ncbi:MAG: anthranilate synthase component I family protein [Cyanobacteriota bacterium]